MRFQRFIGKHFDKMQNMRWKFLGAIVSCVTFNNFHFETFFMKRVEIVLPRILWKFMKFFSLHEKSFFFNFKSFIYELLAK